jgi:hypothetical protein
VANNLLQDAVLRPGDGSLFAPQSRAGPAGVADHSPRIWLCMLALTVALAAFVWRRRTPAPGRAPTVS